MAKFLLSTELDDGGGVEVFSGGALVCRLRQTRKILISQVKDGLEAEAGPDDETVHHFIIEGVGNHIDRYQDSIIDPHLAI